jgi:hypothetical protein
MGLGKDDQQSILRMRGRQGGEGRRPAAAKDAGTAAISSSLHGTCSVRGARAAGTIIPALLVADPPHIEPKNSMRSAISAVLVRRAQLTCRAAAVGRVSRVGPERIV